jgi:PKD repeat protein
MFARAMIIVVAILSVTSMSAGSLGQVPANRGSAASPPQYPYNIYGYVWQKGSTVPVSGATVWVNDTTNGCSQDTDTNAQGSYQADLVYPLCNTYGKGDNITVTAIWTYYVATNWTTVSWVGVVQTQAGGSWCNVTLAAAPLTASMYANPDTLFIGQQTILSVVTSGGIPPDTFVWTFGDGSPTLQTTTNASSHTYTTAGTFQANVTVTDSHMVNASSSVTVYVLLPPTLSLSFRPTLPQVGTNVTFRSSLSIAGNGWTYFFNFGDGKNSGYLSSGVAPVHSYAAKGNYTANSTAYNITSGYRVDSATVLVPVGPAMAVGLTIGPSPTEVGLSTLFTASSSNSYSAVKYVFNFGDGTATVGPQSSPNAHHNYTAAGSVTASVAGTNATGAKASASVPLTVLAHVQVSWVLKPVSGQAPIYVPVRATASKGLGPYAYTMTFTGPSYGATFKNASGYANVTISQSGTYKVGVKVVDSLGVTAWGTNLTFNVTTYVAPLTASIHGPSTEHTGVNLTFNLNFSGGQGPYTVTWLYGDGATSGVLTGVTTSPLLTAHTYNNANTYEVTAFVNDSVGHSAKATWNVTVSQSSSPPPPFFGITALSVLELTLIIVVIAIVLILILVFVWRRRKKRKEEEQVREAAAAIAAEATAGTAAAEGSAVPSSDAGSSEPQAENSSTDSPTQESGTQESPQNEDST